MEAFLKKKVVEPLLEKIKDWIEEVLESNEDKERQHLLSAITAGEIPAEEIALNLGVSVPTVRLVLKAERFRRSLENVFDVVSNDIIRKLLEIIQDIQNIKKTLKQKQLVNQNSILNQNLTDQMDVICQLGLSVADLAQLFDLTEADAVAFIRAHTHCDEIPILDVEQTELPMVASALPQSPQLEECGSSESNSDCNEFCEAISNFRHILNPIRERVTIIDRNTILNEVMELYDKIQVLRCTNYA